MNLLGAGRGRVGPGTIKLRVVLAGAILVLLGVGVFLWKAVVLELPLLPEQPEGLWQVELAITARSPGGEVAVKAALPEPGDRQLVFGEQFSSGRLRLALREEASSGRVAVWRGSPEGPFSLGAGFRVRLDRTAEEIPTRGSAPPPEEIAASWAGDSPGFPADDPAVLAVVEGMTDIAPDDAGAWARSLYAFVRHEIRHGTADDPLLVLQTGEGSEAGREQLLATLLRAAGLPARLVRGLELGEGTTRPRIWCEVWLEDRWWPISVANRFFGNLPPDFLTFGPSAEPVVVAKGVDALDYRFEALRERLSPQEVATLMTPDAGPLRWLSLHRLPAGTQAALRLLLLLPVGALILTVLRNVVGLPSYGTFMPMLIALALRGTGLSMGLLLVGIVLGIGVFGRLLITQLRLLLVPRLSVLLSLVVITVAVLSLLGLEFEDRDFFAGILFPIVILTMLIERFSITLAEEGVLEALQRAAWSLVLAVAVYPVFRIERLESLLFSYPELILAVIGVLVWLGAYTGYRFSDVLRFRTSGFEATS